MTTEVYDVAVFKSRDKNRPDPRRWWVGKVSTHSWVTWDWFLSARLAKIWCSRVIDERSSL